MIITINELFLIENDYIILNINLIRMKFYIYLFLFPFSMFSQGVSPNGQITGTPASYVSVNGALAAENVSRNGSLNYGTGISFEGTDDYVSFPASVYFSGNFTIECWVYPRSFGNWARIIDFGNGAGVNNILLVYTNGTSGIPTFYVEGAQFDANQAIIKNQWTHIAATLSGTTATIYINGVASGTSTFSTPPANVTRNNCYIGKSNWGGGDAYSNAVFDELRIWNTAKTQTEIQTSMYRQLIGTESGLVTYCNFNQGVSFVDNTAVTSLTDLTSNARNGTLTNFTLTGSISNWVKGAPLIFDGLTSASASSSAYAIKQAYPSSTDGLYWIKNNSINGGTPFQIYADMTTDGGGWTLIMTNSSTSGWTGTNAILRNESSPSISACYSILSYADYIKKSSTGFQYMLEATTRGRWGGIWTVNSAYSFVSTSNANTNITFNTQFDTWTYPHDGGIEARMPYYASTASGIVTTSIDPGGGSWWGTLITNGGWNPAPYLGCCGNGAPGIIWYWVR